MKIADLYTLYIQHGLVDTDTRNIRENTLFFALKGMNFNGNKFAEQALKKGAKFAIIDEVAFKTSDKTILVEDVLKTLQDLSSYHRKKLGIPIIAITGSNGKTTTKELINVVLSSTYKTIATIGNLNNHIGVPLTLLSMTKKTEIGIVEMGANHPNEIAFLTKIIQPDFGYITNFGSAHLEGFGSLEGVIKAKSELYDFLIKNNKNIFVNPKDAIQVAKTKDANAVLFEKSIGFIRANPFVKLSFASLEIQSNLIGAYNFSNISAAITIGDYFKISKEKIKASIEKYTSSNNRSQVIKTQNNSIILDAYNANPTSMKVALESFNILDAKHKTVILGDMFELGNYSKRAHQTIVDLTLSFNFDKAFFVGENFNKTEIKCQIKDEIKCQKCISFEALKEYLQKIPIKESTILIKGSRGMALERIVKYS
ncbi:UDP-N-acetylmuramoyl-tripeptide--D-alanyl-D-alanine ligase [Tenacibaculum dicentrarchi]|nr:UDP-N-acetylmuramoyl-tripeptide--D-alanyl-D-alanine ligase [Tenacibaculum dicentrarchi]MCD8408204.1 UDP-N-acetylmuramoyl-tripeptide--D-alanyl-D-alanine ligase [Tenacibaculum dicentrarchi]MCD8425809.1 UDP-N-acetylmuramoyl-tripeptide--D-alanyl-D-alanine ligase [Tenacibaculum dicentrarchi]MCD8442852.1 UDP-N-acetylmuramoyl-tripeptide--D-alanyl-D-alanine ligase [Tenacibaculum dicentrarchi]MCD8450246.1 UDP-N-acetylmuramoyl-tripeptide--D-alanyl-D-alanine ligase [Tenacibaculum dicentrarchi]